MRVGIDLDGVCYDFGASLRRFLCHVARTHDSRDCTTPTRWEFYEDWGLTLREFLDACHEGVDAGVVFTHGDPFPYVSDAFQRIKNHGHTIHVVTDRSFGSNGRAEAATRAWLDRYKLPFDSLTFTADKTVVRLDTMVDDKLENYHALKAAGVDVWLHTRPWNQHDSTATNRVLDLLHYAEVIQYV